MINLIPPEGHKTARKEYIFRVGATIALLFSGVALCLAVALIPTYLLISTQTTALNAEIAQNDVSTEAIKEAEADVVYAEKMIAQFRNASSSESMSTLITEVRRLAPPAITFKNFSIDGAKSAVLKMQVQGTAPTREVLATFKTALETSDLFLKAEIPIADLARDKDVPFSINITVAKSK